MNLKKLLSLAIVIALTSCYGGCARNAKTVSKDDLQVIQKDGKTLFCATQDYFLFMCQARIE